MIGFIIGLLIFLSILAMVYKYGNENRNAQRNNQKKWTDSVVEEINKIKGE